MGMCPLLSQYLGQDSTANLGSKWLMLKVNGELFMVVSAENVHLLHRPMSIRIQNDALSGSSAAETSRTQDVVQIGSHSSNAASRSGGPTDSVEISSLFNRISDASNSLEAAQNKRVNYLTQLYQSGRYQVDSAAVSRALVSQALGSSGTEG